MTRLATLTIALLLAAASVASAQVATAPAPERLTSGDWSTDVGLSRMTLTPEQKDQLRPTFQTFAKEAQDARDAAAERAKDPAEKIKALHDRAKKDGTLADLPNDPNFQALQAKLNKISLDLSKDAAARHQRILDALMKVLTTQQKRDFLMHSGPATFDQKRFLMSRAMTVIDHWAPGITLPDNQYDPLVKKLTSMIERQDADIAAIGDADQTQISQWWAALDKKMRALIEAELTEEQKTQAAANRLERYQKFVATATDGVAKSIDRLNPTENQTAKAAEFAAAAREKMLHLDPEARENWGALYMQLRQDINELLTDDQRTLANTPVQVNPN